MTQGAIRIGSRVKVRDADGDSALSLVEAHEADCMLDRISPDSPLGRALLGRRQGDEVLVRAPGGVRTVTVVEVQP